MRKISSVLTLILVVCLSIGGVSAAWVYAAGAPIAELKELLVSIGDWKFSYTVRYINNGEDLIDPIEVPYDTTYTVANSDAVAALEAQLDELDAAGKLEYSREDYAFDYWMNAGSTKIETIPSDNREDIILYPSFVDIFTAMFVDKDGNIIKIDENTTAWTTFTATTAGYTKVKNMGTTELAPTITNFAFLNWEVHETNDKGETTNTYALTDLSSKFGKTDITVYPVYQYNGAASLTPVDSDGDGDTDYYQADGYTNGTGSKLIEIPNEVDGIPVTTISADAFSSYNDLTAVKIPESINIIGGAAFSDSTWDRQTVTLYYEGTPEQWATYMEEVYTDGNYEHLASNWDYALGEGSRVFFLDEQDHVINTATAGYWELANTGSWLRPNYVWQYHAHAFPYSGSGCSNEHNQNDTDYDADGRVDKNYWITTDDEAASEETTE